MPCKLDCTVHKPFLPALHSGTNFRVTIASCGAWRSCLAQPMGSLSFADLVFYITTMGSCTRLHCTQAFLPALHSGTQIFESPSLLAAHGARASPSLWDLCPSRILSSALQRWALATLRYIQAHVTQPKFSSQTDRRKNMQSSKAKSQHCPPPAMFH